MDITKFIISNTKYLKINPECIHENECETCTQIDIDYVDEKKNICIRFGYKPFRSFCYFFVKSGIVDDLNNKKKLINDNDLGFEWNQYYEGRIKDTDVLEEYHFTGNSHKQIRPYYNSWFYNDKEGNIIFEITPFYPWHNTTKKRYPEKISYKEWIKSYKPVVKTIIPKKNLKQWIKQAEELAKVYKLNL